MGFVLHVDASRVEPRAGRQHHLVKGKFSRRDVSKLERLLQNVHDLPDLPDSVCLDARIAVAVEVKVSRDAGKAVAAHELSPVAMRDRALVDGLPVVSKLLAVRRDCVCNQQSNAHTQLVRLDRLHGSGLLSEVLLRFAGVSGDTRLFFWYFAKRSFTPDTSM